MCLIKDETKETIHNSMYEMLQIVNSTEEGSLLQNMVVKEGLNTSLFHIKFCTSIIFCPPSLHLVVDSLFFIPFVNQAKLWPRGILPL